MSSASEEIQQNQWPTFFEDLAREYEGCAVSVEVLGADIGDQPVESGLPLQGFSFETQGSQAGDLLIEAGDTGTTFEVHRVAHPTHVRVATLQPGSETDLEVESADGIRTLVHIRRQPELPPSSEGTGIAPAP